MSGMKSLSNPCYLPIYESASVRNPKFTGVWRNFVNELGVTFPSGWNNPAQERIKEWNGRLINDVVEFKSDKDKMWFILNWS